MARSRYNQQIQRRQTKAYQQNMMAKERQEDKKNQAKNRRNRWFYIGGLIALGALVILSIMFWPLWATILCVAAFVGFSIFMMFMGRRMQKNAILRLKDQGMTKGALLRSMELRGEKQRNIDAYAKMWDKYAAPKKAIPTDEKKGIFGRLQGKEK